SLQSQGIDMKTYLSLTGGDEAKLRDTFRDQAVKQVRCRLALEKIAELEKVTVSPEEVEAKYAELAEQYGMEAEQIKKFVTEEEITADLKNSKALTLVKDAADVTEAKPEAAAPAKKAAPKKSDDKKDLSGMTKAQLQEYAAEKGIEVKASMTKAAMIEAIEAAE
ncbi:MAG TPA: hypothetical protein PLS28_02140, partial [Clostridiales bacterium]|nr:hypothetical protein [Clostridiales bacterium]